MQPKISIVIPAYNVESYIRATLESVKRQTCSEIEVIVVNDGSKGKTLEVARQTLENAKFPWVVIDQINRGVSVARNVGLSKASGEYVLFLDGDDRISELFVEKMYKNKERDYDVVFCKWNKVGIDDGEVSLKMKYESTFNPKVQRGFENGAAGVEVLRDVLKFKIWIWTASAIYRRNFLIDNHLLFSPQYWVGEDTDFIFRALLRARTVASVPYIS